MRQRRRRGSYFVPAGMPLVGVASPVFFPSTDRLRSQGHEAGEGLSASSKVTPFP